MSEKIKKTQKGNFLDRSWCRKEQMAIHLFLTKLFCFKVYKNINEFFKIEKIY